MGHSETFYFVDVREGECGVEYNRQSWEEIEQVAISRGYSGPIQVRITAYPPKPSAHFLEERAIRALYGYADDEFIL